MALPVRACPVCKKWHWRRALCESCAERLWHWREPFVRKAFGFTVQSLFAWRQDGVRALDWWLHSLKHQEDPLMWREPAVWFLDAFSPAVAELLLIPIPGRGRGGNHAMGFARALSLVCGGRIVDSLGSVRGPEQKDLDRTARSHRRFELKSSFTTDSRLVVIVDDVITTGATAAAAHRALGRPAPCEVWCLMDRRPCGTLTPLL